MKKKIKKILQIPPIRVYEIYRDNILLKKRKIKQESLLRVYLENNNEKKLHIGCGANVLPGWFNTDFNDINENVAFLDAGDKFPLAKESFDYVFSEHLFEHLDVSQQINMLKESWRILKPGGLMRIAMPSLEFLFDLYSTPTKPENRDYVNWYVKNSPYLSLVNEKVADESYHYCYIINNFFKAWGHKMIHNFDSLKNLALQIGFCEIIETEVGISDYKSLQDIEKHGTIIPANFNRQETMVVEIKK
jgi:predicted SAM-dependent methyltransferase